ncbi:hypothetical protein BH11ACT3_BH11ACT3_13470 [soil metagenome]
MFAFVEDGESVLCATYGESGPIDSYGQWRQS